MMLNKIQKAHHFFTVVIFNALKSNHRFYGGLICNYQPVSKLNLNANIYYMDDQTLVFQYETGTVEAKPIVSFKGSYKVWKENSVYFNARNLFNNQSNEFAFMDSIGAEYLVGVNLNF